MTFSLLDVLLFWITREHTNMETSVVDSRIRGKVTEVDITEKNSCV